MNPVFRWLRNGVHRIKRTFYEGPNPPERLSKIVEAFAAEHPNATVREWIEFASAHGNECYTSGYIRGVEWQHRDLDQKEKLKLIRELDPRHDWIWKPATTAEVVMERVVPPDYLPPEGEGISVKEQAELAELMAEMRRNAEAVRKRRI